MKLNKYLLLSLGSAATLLGFQAVNHQNVLNYELASDLSSRAPAGAGLTFDELMNYVHQNINGGTKVFATVQELLGEIIQDHNNSEAKKGKIVIMNKIGTSDSDYADKEGLKKMAQSEMRVIAKRLAAEGGGTIVVGAGNTNTGIGRYISAIQSPEFTAELSSLGVRIKFFGISSEQAAINHGPYEQNKYGTDFMNDKLDFTVLIPDPDGTWKVLKEGISQVVEFSVLAAQEAAKNGVIAESIITGTEGGAIGMGELTMYLFEMQRAADKLGIPLENLTSTSKMILQVGLASGDQAGEVAANKGPKATTDLLIALDRMVDASPDLADIIFKSNITVEIYMDSAEQATKTVALKTEADLKAVVSDALKVEADTLKLAKEYNQMLKNGKPESAIDTELGLLDKATLKQLGKDLKVASGEDAAIIRGKIARSLAVVRAREFRNSILTTVRAVEELSKIYSNGARKSARLARLLSEAVVATVHEKKNALEIDRTSGKVVRAKVTQAAKAVETAKKSH